MKYTMDPEKQNDPNLLWSLAQRQVVAMFQPRSHTLSATLMLDYNPTKISQVCALGRGESLLVSWLAPAQMDSPDFRYIYAKHGEVYCWYVETQQWFKSHGISINALIEWSKLVPSTWNIKYHGSALHLLEGRWPTVRRFSHTSEDWFIIRPSYMDIHLSHALRRVIGQLRTNYRNC